MNTKSKKIIRPSGKQRGRPTHDDSDYEALLSAWEADQIARPALLVKARIADFLRKRIPENLGLNRTKGH